MDNKKETWTIIGVILTFVGIVMGMYWGLYEHPELTKSLFNLEENNTHNNTKIIVEEKTIYINNTPSKPKFEVLDDVIKYKENRHYLKGDLSFDYWGVLYEGVVAFNFIEPVSELKYLRVGNPEEIKINSKTYSIIVSKIQNNNVTYSIYEK